MSGESSIRSPDRGYGNIGTDNKVACAQGARSQNQDAPLPYESCLDESSEVSSHVTFPDSGYVSLDSSPQIIMVIPGSRHSKEKNADAYRIHQEQFEHQDASSLESLQSALLQAYSPVYSEVEEIVSHGFYFPQIHTDLQYGDVNPISPHHGEIRTTTQVGHITV